ncbi:ABC transporter transmembrane domain-containing protein [Ktedonosporobacter rubrisoli]|uniref:ABC transporter transmembrane domain-containing protein n=1 Tax=Ktedonosporobacter rubrisoli TaxID=2509675 RepID=UPI001F5DF1A6|nr:ABC transporter ATP-binding protein [Ktedonosporobacter rubrisoli]
MVSAQQTPKVPLSSYRDFLITYLKPQWQRTLLMTILLLTGIGLQLANPQIIRYFIDTASNEGSLNALFLAGGLFVGIALANQAISIWATYVSENVAWTATNQLRTDLVAHCLNLDMDFHKSHTAGELIERIDGDVDALSNFFSQAIIHLLGNILLIVGIIGLSFFTDWRVGLLMAVFSLLALLILNRLWAYAQHYWQEQRQKNAEFFGFLSEQLSSTEDLRANGATQYVMLRFYKLLRAWLPITRKSSLAGYSMWMSTLLIFAIGNALAFVLGAYLWSHGVITIGTTYIIFYYINLLTEPLEQVRTQLQALQQAGAGIQRVQQLLQTQPAIQDKEGLALPAGALSVEFRAVSFGYTPDEPVLHDLNFQLAAGKALGLLGRTGSGKSSIAPAFTLL